MDRCHFILLFLCAIYIAAFQGAMAIKCWHCNSEFDPFCRDPFDNRTAKPKDCSEEEELPHLRGIPATMCRKIRMKIYGEWRYKRDCARLGEPGLGGDERYCIYRSGTFNLHTEYCTCNDKENCNAASQVRGYVGWLGVAVVALVWRSWAI
ncbi:hypothetical protein FHG87_008643 [Trinorchestia longiramus]|nr:hypothetical protein FHG87_008643 [Trinorchestia longiramus]